MKAYKNSSGEIIAVFKSSIDGKHYNIYRRRNGEFKVIHTDHAKKRSVKWTNLQHIPTADID